MAQRINARIDDELAEKLEQLSKLTGKSTSAIVKLALDAYYDRIHMESAYPRQALLASGFVGCADGDPGLSTDYKDELKRSWSRKV
jgi:predicted transcriptional regulator